MQDETKAARNVALYPWFKFAQSLTFWVATWFLYFQNVLSAADAILLYVVFDVGTTLLEVPSGYMSDRIGRRFTLIASAIAGFLGASLLALGQSFEVFAVGQLLLGASMAFSSGTDSALLYETLKNLGRQNETEQQELRAWRFSFIAFALAALIGGVLAQYSGAFPFAESMAAFAGMFALTLAFQEPLTAPSAIQKGVEISSFETLKSAFRMPVLLWLFGLSVLMYVFSHILFVFGQPFILDTLKGTGFENDAAVVSGGVATIMMVVSVVTSLFALKLRRKIGLPAILLLAFAIQIGLIGALSANNSTIIVALLFLRMVPNSLSRPFILARIQPLLSSEIRATFMSLQSFLSRLILAGTLFFASFWTSSSGQMEYSEIQQILGWYLLAGVVSFIGLAILLRRIQIENRSAT